MPTPSAHHLVYGKCTDFLTGEEIPDTDDERRRQNIARLLVENRGYDPTDILKGLSITTSFAGRTVVSRIDFGLRVANRVFLIIRYAAGSVVTRERAAIAAARVVVPEYRVPLAVVTNGDEVELLDSASGRVLATGWAAIPLRDEARAMLPHLPFSALTNENKRERELRLLNAFDDEECCAASASCAAFQSD